MITVISPAKTFNKDPKKPSLDYTEPSHLTESEKLMGKLRGLNNKKLGELMNLSKDLVALNQERHTNWQPPFTEENADPAIFMFYGEVYRGLDADSLDENDLAYAQDHLRILSGLYGVLKPLDLIQPYRLEMGAKLKYYKKNNLYQFWGDEITKTIAKDLGDPPVLINLASNEYFKSINLKKLKARMIVPTFKDFSNGEYKSLMTYAKNARGMMARYIIQERIEDPELLKSFNGGGYAYSPERSDDENMVFIR